MIQKLSYYQNEAYKKFLNIKNDDDIYDVFMRCVRENFDTLLKKLIDSLTEEQKKVLVNTKQGPNTLHPITRALDSAHRYGDRIKGTGKYVYERKLIKTSDEIFDKEKETNSSAINMLYILIDLYKCEGKELVDEVKNSYNETEISEWLNLNDLYYDGEIKNEKH